MRGVGETREQVIKKQTGRTAIEHCESAPRKIEAVDYIL
jgi:hypothetical protein